MRKFYTLLATLALVSTTLWGATNYGLKVGGVSITSDNCSNVTGSNIVAYNAGSEHFVKYDPNTKTLTLKNIKIERSGSYNRAILNDDVDGFTIVFIGGANLAAKDAGHHVPGGELPVPRGMPELCRPGIAVGKVALAPDHLLAAAVGTAPPQPRPCVHGGVPAVAMAAKPPHPRLASAVHALRREGKVAFPVPLGQQLLPVHALGIFS